MIKVMHLDMFYFEYKPILSEYEKVIFMNEQIKVLFKNNERVLKNSDVSNIKLDTLFAKRLKQNWSNDEILDALKNIKSDSQKENDKYKLCIIKHEDEITVTFNYMRDTLTKLKYDGQQFECIAHNK